MVAASEGLKYAADNPEITGAVGEKIFWKDSRRSTRDLVRFAEIQLVSFVTIMYM